MRCVIGWRISLANACLLSYALAGKLNRPILNYFHGTTVQNLVSTTWSILYGNVSSFRLFFAQHQTVVATLNCRRFYRSPACNTCRARYCYGKSVCLSTLLLYRNECLCRQTLSGVWWGHDPISWAPPPLKIPRRNPSAMALYTRRKFEIVDQSRGLTWKRYETCSRLLYYALRIDPCRFHWQVKWPWKALDKSLPLRPMVLHFVH